MKLSVVTTLYRSAGTIDEFKRRIVEAARPVADTLEIVMVNDGSPDDSLARALALHDVDPRVTVVDLARNFGHHKAMMTGLAHASGDFVFLIDSDLEEAPELLGTFLERLGSEQCDVVYGTQQVRKGGLFEQISGAVFFWMVDILSDRPLPRNLITARLMRRPYVQALVRHRDRDFVISDLWQTTGFRQVALRVQKLSLSPTSYSFRQRLTMAVKHITTSSTKLLHLLLYSGLSISILSALAILYIVTRYMLNGIGIDGWTSLIASVWFFGGMTMLFLGVIGIYVSTILSESKRRPYTVVRRVHRRRPAEAATSASGLDGSA